MFQMIHNQRKLLLILLALLLMAMVACSSSEPAVVDAPETTEEVEEVAEEEVAEEEMAEEEMAEEEMAEEEMAEEEMAESTEITVSHPQGEITLMTHPERIVVFNYSALDTLDALGLGEYVVGVPQGPLMPAHLAQYNGEAYTNVGSFFEADLEAVNALDPDLIIVGLRTSPFYEDMSNIAPTIDVTVDSANVVETFKAYVNNIGVIFGVEDEAADRLADIDAQIEAVKSQAEASSYKGLIVLTTGGEVSGYGPGSRFGLIHDVLGVAATDSPMVAETHGDTISFEFILEENPDVIYVIDRDTAVNAEGDTAQQILDNELVNSTTAGEQGNIIYLNSANWYLVNAGLTTFADMISEVGSGLVVSTAEEITEEEMAEEEMAEPTEITIIHPQGETTLMTHPERVVVFNYSALDTLDALGLGDYVVGVPQGPLMPAHLSQYNDESITNVGSFFEADLEAVNALDPDLIIVGLRTSPFYEDMSAIAPTIDVTVDSADVVNTTVAYVNNIGAIFGVEDQVAEKLAAIQAQIAETQALAAESGYQGLIVLTSGGEVSGYGPGSRFGLIHDVLGVAPTGSPMVAETHGDTISFEFILQEDPDVIYVIDRDTAVNAEGDTAQQILDNELVNSTKAGANSNIIYLNPVNWYLASSGLNTISEMISEVALGLGE